MCCCFTSINPSGVLFDSLLDDVDGVWSWDYCLLTPADWIMFDDNIGASSEWVAWLSRSRSIVKRQTDLQVFVFTQCKSHGAKPSIECV